MIKIFDTIKGIVRIALMTYPKTAVYAVPAFQALEELRKEGSTLEHDLKTDELVIRIPKSTTVLPRAGRLFFKEGRQQNLIDKLFKCANEEAGLNEEAKKATTATDKEPVPQQPDEPDFSTWHWWNNAEYDEQPNTDTHNKNRGAKLREAYFPGMEHLEKIKALPIDFECHLHPSGKFEVSQPESDDNGMQPYGEDHYNKRRLIMLAFGGTSLIQIEDSGGCYGMDDSRFKWALDNGADYIMAIHTQRTKAVSRTKMTRIER